MKKTCYFCGDNGECGALMNCYCAGINYDCKFYKTEEQYIAERNRAVEINRAKGNCDNCKYRSVKCAIIPKNKNNAEI